MSNGYIRDKQTIGRYVLYMQGEEVAIEAPESNTVRVLEPGEALMLLNWLNQHKDELYRSLQQGED